MNRFLAVGATLSLSPVLAFAAGATPLFERITVGDGLPAMQVSQVAEDRAGYLWLATADGLARYDGVEFRVWRPVEGDPNALPGNDVQTVFVDRADRVWAGIEDGGLVQLDRTRETVRRFDVGAGLPSNEVWALAEDSRGALWIGTYAGGLARLADGRIVAFRHDDADVASLPADDVLAVLVAADDRVFVGTTAGLWTFMAATAPAGAQRLLDGEFVMSLAATDDGAILVGTRTGLFRLSRELVATKLELPIAQPLVEGFAPDGDGGHWVATHHGLLRFAADGAVSAIPARPGVPHGLPGEVVLDLHRDHEGGLWLGMLGAGLAHLKPTWRNFALLRDPDPAFASAGEGWIAALGACADGRAWMAAANGALARFDPRDGTFEHFLATPEQRAALPSTRFWSVACARDGTAWIGHRKGLTHFDPAAVHSNHWLGDGKPGHLTAGFVDLLLEDRDGVIWAAANGGGLNRVDPASGAVTPFGPDVGGPRSLEIEQLALDRDGALWAAGNAGLDRYDRATWRFVPVAVAVAVAGAARIHALAFDRENTPWVYAGGKLLRLRADGAGGFAVDTSFGAAHGFEIEQLGGMDFDARGALWLYGPRGLRRFDPGSGQLRSFQRADGLVDLEFGRRPPVRAADGAFLLPTSLGVLAFDPAALADNPVAPNLVIAHLATRRDGLREELAPPAPGATLTLEHDSRSLEIAVRALSLADPGSNRYRFRLRGIESAWVDAGARGERSYEQLPIGAYVLEVEGSNGSGVFAEPPLALPLRVRPPPWRTGWAYVGYALFALVALDAGRRGYRLRIERRHLMRLAEERRHAAERESRAKSAFLADVGHEIRTPMSGLIGMTELLLASPLAPQQREYAQTVQRSGRHLVALVNDLLDLSRIEAGQLRLVPAPFDPRALVDEVIALQQPLAREKGLALGAAVDPALPRRLLGDATRVRQIVLNLANNALKFTQKGSVALRAGWTPGVGCNFELEDTGPGMTPDEVARLFERFRSGQPGTGGGAGLGLSICKRLAELMGGAIAVESTPGVGTRFDVRLPLREVDDASPAPAAPTRVPGALRVLLVEDDATTRATIAGLLELQGHEVRDAAQGLDAITSYAAGAFDALLLDLDLPALDGIALLDLMRARDPALPPALAISARSTPETEAACRAAGFAGFLRKPFGGDELAAALAALVPQQSDVAPE